MDGGKLFSVVRGDREGVMEMKLNMEMIKVAEQVTRCNGGSIIDCAALVPWGEPESLSLVLFAIGKCTKK